MDRDTPFHDGELAVQQRAGMRDKVAAIGPRMIRDHMPDQHRELFGKLPTLIVGSLDTQCRPWASMLVGQPGFVSSPDARTLHVAALPDVDDPLAAALTLDAPLGLLGLEPATRRRNRMNGHVATLDGSGFDIAVEQSFGNCPQYIQARDPDWVEGRGVTPAQRFAAALPEAARRLVRRADTLFIASAAAGGVDVSHRGGRPGFVRVEHDATGADVLTLPDFRGNNLFNTLGNIAAWPRAGLLFFDADRGDRLQLTGRAEVLWDGPELAAFAGAKRLLRIVVEAGAWTPAVLPLRWSSPEPAVQLRETGVWPVSALSDTDTGRAPMEPARGNS